MFFQEWDCNMVHDHQPIVCICIPTYNAEQTIYETLQSILLQTYRHIEVHIVDNASTDDTLDIVRSFQDPRVVIHAHTNNVGAEGNFNRCIQLCTHDFTAIYHADDIYEPQMVAKQVQFLLANPNVGGVLTEAMVIDEQGRQIGRITTPKDIKTTNHIYNFKLLMQAVLKHSNFMMCPSAMLRTSVYQQTIQTWRGTLFATSADLDVWLRVAKYHGIGILSEPLMRYRVSTFHGSAKVKRSSLRADFFKVMDFYLNEDDEVKSFVTAKDRANYRDLERRNIMMRATNLFLEGHIMEAKALCGSFFSPSMIYAAFKNKRGQLTLCLNALLHFFIFFNLQKLGRSVFQFLLGRFAR